MANVLEIYCDGACSGNPGKGGWGAILIWDQTTKEISGSVPETTNNRMELTAAIESLKAVKKKVKIAIYTDSMYVCQGITTWIHTWKKNNWRAKNKVIKNIDLWQELDTITSDLDISWHWVKGHNNNLYNDIADKLATEAIKNGK